jgi:hypothetical protein
MLFGCIPELSYIEDKSARFWAKTTNELWLLSNNDVPWLISSFSQSKMFDISFPFNLRVILLSLILAISSLSISYFISIFSFSDFTIKESANAASTLPIFIRQMKKRFCSSLYPHYEFYLHMDILT